MGTQGYRYLIGGGEGDWEVDKGAGNCHSFGLSMRIPIACLLAFLCFATLLSRDVPAQAAPIDGGQIYTANCLSCHQADGKGLPNLAPALKDNAILSGDPSVLIQILLKGPAAVLPEDRPKFGSSTMDSFYYKLSDEEIAAVLDYVRKTFGKDGKAAPVSVKAVTEARAKIDEESSAN